MPRRPLRRPLSRSWVPSSCSDPGAERMFIISSAMSISPAGMMDAASGMLSSSSLSADRNTPACAGSPDPPPPRTARWPSRPSNASEELVLLPAPPLPLTDNSASTTGPPPPRPLPPSSGDGGLGGAGVRGPFFFFFFFFFFGVDAGPPSSSSSAVFSANFPSLLSFELIVGAVVLVIRYKYVTDDSRVFVFPEYRVYI